MHIHMCCVGDAAYHELSITFNDVPMSYLIKQRKSYLNQIFHIARIVRKACRISNEFQDKLQAQIKKKVYSFHFFDVEEGLRGRGRGELKELPVYGVV